VPQPELVQLPNLEESTTTPKVGEQSLTDGRPKLNIITAFTVKNQWGDEYLQWVTLEDRDFKDVEFTTAVVDVSDFRGKVLINPNLVVAIDARDN